MSKSSSVERRTIKEQAVQLYVKEVLQSRLFMGSFTETRLVNSINAYRNVVVVNSEECDLIRDLDMVRTYLQRFYGQQYWIGISKDDASATPSGCCLWVELFDQIFGNYWYKISKIKFRENEVLLCLKVVRSINNSSSVSSNVSVTDKSVSRSRDFPEVDFNEILPALKVKLGGTLLAVKEVLTLGNVKEGLKFSVLLVAALFTGLIGFFEHFGDFAIKLLREISNIIRVSTPFLLACVDLIAKIFGGFYLLLLGIWRDWNRPKTYERPPRLTYNQNRKAIS